MSLTSPMHDRFAWPQSLPSKVCPICRAKEAELAPWKPGQTHCYRCQFWIQLTEVECLPIHTFGVGGPDDIRPVAHLIRFRALAANRVFRGPIEYHGEPRVIWEALIALQHDFVLKCREEAG